MDIVLLIVNRLNIVLIIVLVIERVMSVMIHMDLNIMVGFSNMMLNWNMEMGIFMKHLLMS